MRRTAVRVEVLPSVDYPGRYEAIPCEKITCEVRGEMGTGRGRKIWVDVNTNEQYFLLRMRGEYAFYKE